MPGRPYKPFVGNMLEAIKEEAMTNTIRWMKDCKSNIIRFYYFNGEERVLVADPAMVKHILVTNSKNYVRINTAIENILPNFLLVKSGEEHHSLRKLMNPAFNSQAVNEFLPTFEDISREVVRAWRSQLAECGQPQLTVPAQNYMGRLTLDIICRCGFGYEMNSIADAESSAVKSFQTILKDFTPSLSTFLPAWIPTKKKRKLWVDWKVFNSVICSVIEEKKSQQSPGKKLDLLDRLLLAHNEQGEPLSDAYLKDQVGGFLFAGFETTSTALTWTLLQLAEHEDIQDKARQEVTSLLTDGSQPITMDIADKLQYLACVIKETLRLLPPITTIFRKTVEKDILGGYTVPAGTPVGISAGALHRLESNWSDPDSFKPERFLEDYDQYKFIPFSRGPYMCIGVAFSLLESKVALALILRHFRFSLPDGYKYRRTRQLTMQPSPALQLVIEAV